MNSAPVPSKLFVGTILLVLSFCGTLWAQTRPIAILGSTLIDGSGRPAVTDAAIVIQGGRFQEVGRRGRVRIPEGAEVIEAGGKTILPGLIDGHCHYQDWMDELYLAYGVTTCPDIYGNAPELLTAKRAAIQNGATRGPRLWLAGSTLDGPLPPQTQESRRARSGVIVTTPAEARQAVQNLVAKGVDGLKFYEYMAPEVARSAAEEAHRLGRPVFGHARDIFVAAEVGYDSIEHFSAVVYSSIADQQRKTDLEAARISGQIGTGEFHVYLESDRPEWQGRDGRRDRIIRLMVDKNIHWSPTWATWFRPYSSRAADMKQQELALFQDSRFRIPVERARVVEELYAAYEQATPERRAELAQGFRKLEDFVRRFVAAGGKLHAGSDPNRVTPAFALHVELDLLVAAGLTPVQAIQAASQNVAQAWRKDKDYGSVEQGKVADLVIVSGDLTQDITATQNVENVELVFQGGRLVGGSLYRNP